jgi:hypothetical protein
VSELGLELGLVRARVRVRANRGGFGGTFGSDAHGGEVGLVMEPHRDVRLAVGDPDTALA